VDLISTDAVFLQRPIPAHSLIPASPGGYLLGAAPARGEVR
jgi:hypothetical protein